MGKIVICETTLDYFDGIDSNIINPDEDIIIFSKYQFVVYNNKIILGTQVLFIPTNKIARFYELDGKYPYRYNKFLNPWVIDINDEIGFLNFIYDSRTPLCNAGILLRPYRNDYGNIYYPNINYYYLVKSFDGIEFEGEVE